MTAVAGAHRTAEECFRFVASAFSAQLRWDIGKLTGCSGPRQRECASRAFRLRLLDDPVLCHSSAIAAAMMQAMAAILASAGFAVEDAHDEYRSHQLRVTDTTHSPFPVPHRFHHLRHP
ncbi:hypothetical protein ACQ86D_01900 [Streptomyces galilaeus]